MSETFTQDEIAQIKKIREEKEIGLYEAKRIFVKQRMINYIDSVTTIEEIKAILQEIVNNGI